MTTNLLVERAFATPVSVADVHALVRESAWCYELYDAVWCGSFLAVDGRKMVCLFSAPDAESARMALRRSGADLRALWNGTVHESEVPAIPNVLVERSFAQPVTVEQIQAMERAATGCLLARHVNFARAFFSVNGKRMLSLYKAPDAESVRVAQREAALPVDAIWTFNSLDLGTLASDAGQNPV